MLRRFPWTSSRSRPQWWIHNLFFRKGEVTGRNLKDAILEPTPAPGHLPRPPLMPIKKEWRDAVLEGGGRADEFERASVATPECDVQITVAGAETHAVPVE
jgi:hypothetical protein